MLTERQAWFKVADKIDHWGGFLCMEIHELYVKEKISLRTKQQMMAPIRELAKHRHKRCTEYIGAIWPHGSRKPRISFCMEQVKRLTSLDSDRSRRRGKQTKWHVI